MKTLNAPPLNRSSTQRLAVAATGVAVALLAAASPARAQFRVGADGHANDVNNRLGSGGYNSGSDASYRSASNGQIVTGNVTGLGYFHGATNGEFDNNVFQGGVQNGSVDAFTRISAPVNYAAPSNGQSVYTPYYNQQSYVGQSNNYVPTANGVGLIAAPTKSALTPDPGDVRLQNLNNAPLDQNGFNLPTPGSLNGPGPVNNVGDQAIYSQSSLYGVRQMQAGDQTDAQPSTNMFDQRNNGIGRPGSRMDASKISQMQQELRSASTPDAKETDAASDTADLNKTMNPGVSATLSQPGQAGQGQPGQGGQPGQAGDPNAVTGTQLTGTSVAAARVPSSINTPYSTQQNNLLIPANQQSKQIKELERRFSASTPHPTVEQQANQNNRVLLALRAAKDAKIKAAAGGGSDADRPAPAGNGGSNNGGSVGGPSGGATPAGPTGKGGITTTDHPQADAKADLPSVVRDPAAAEPVGNPDSPFVITSLATGIKAPGLSKLLRDAEGQMRSGQFSQSVDTYDNAAEVAPTNPFVPLGRGFAELGASYYGKAETDLTRAILNEPALLAAQYDLKGFLGADRLKFVEKDLTETGATEQTARPFLLLAYIHHNAGADDTTVTAKDLDTAAQRGANPRLIELMREAWNLKTPGK